MLTAQGASGIQSNGAEHQLRIVGVLLSYVHAWARLYAGVYIQAVQFDGQLGLRSQQNSLEMQQALFNCVMIAVSRYRFPSCMLAFCLGLAKLSATTPISARNQAKKASAYIFVLLLSDYESQGACLKNCGPLSPLSERGSAQQHLHDSFRADFDTTRAGKSTL